ncbi:hypothetical protein RHS01_01273 [Rhizoctonia solani]|uniref:Uncharacterized protein n=1 Tax=Rhizoctonia solani TaxID=456999 RepID=A0A8H7IM25_9AGAM|nr:hypothetical protein RHS01_01273 [Rhizoctonia solani]
MSTVDTGQSDSFSQNSDISIAPSSQESNKSLRSSYTTSTRSARVDSVNNVTNPTSRRLRAPTTRLSSYGTLDSSHLDHINITRPNSAPPSSPPLSPQGTGGHRTPKGLQTLYLQCRTIRECLSQRIPSAHRYPIWYLCCGLVVYVTEPHSGFLVSNRSLGPDAIMAATEVERAFDALSHPQSRTSSRTSFHSANATPQARPAPIDGRIGSLPDDDPAEHLKQTLINAAYQYDPEVSTTENIDEMADRLVLGISTIFNFFTAQKTQSEKCTKFSGILGNALQKTLSHIKEYDLACANNFESRLQNRDDLAQEHRSNTHTLSLQPGGAWGDTFLDYEAFSQNPTYNDPHPRPTHVSNIHPPPDSDSRLESMLNSILDKMNRHDEELQEIRRLCKPSQAKTVNPTSAQTERPSAAPSTSNHTYASRTAQGKQQAKQPDTANNTAPTPQIPHHRFVIKVGNRINIENRITPSTAFTKLRPIIDSRSNSIGGQLKEARWNASGNLMLTFSANTNAKAIEAIQGEMLEALGLQGIGEIDRAVPWGKIRISGVATGIHTDGTPHSPKALLDELLYSNKDEFKGVSDFASISLAFRDRDGSVMKRLLGAQLNMLGHRVKASRWNDKPLLKGTTRCARCGKAHATANHDRSCASCKGVGKENHLPCTHQDKCPVCKDPNAPSHAFNSPLCPERAKYRLPVSSILSRQTDVAMNNE